MMMNKNLQKQPHVKGVWPVAATALALLLALFLLPLLFFGGGGGAPAEATPGGLPLDRTPVTPSPSADSGVEVRVSLGENEVLTLPMD